MPAQPQPPPPPPPPPGQPDPTTTNPETGFESPAGPGGRRLWFGCVIGDYMLPPDPNDGEVTVECESGGKKDKKGGAGKDKPSTTKQGSDEVKIKVHLKFTTRSWKDGTYGPGVETILANLDPCNKIGTGGPYGFSHPDASRRGVKDVMIDKIGKLTWKGHLGEVEIDCSEWVPKKDEKSKTDTPDKATDGSQWTAKKSAGYNPANTTSKTSPPKAPSGAPAKGAK